MDTDSNQVRLSALGIVALSLFLALFVRLWFLQGIDRQKFEVASASNRLRVIHEEGPRGRILDRNGKVLVDNRVSIVVALDREPLRKLTAEERTEHFTELADTLTWLQVPTKVSDIQRRYDDKRYAPQEYVPIAEDVPELVEVYLSERAERFPGVVVESRAVRVYPFGTLAAHLLGYVGEINAKELLERGGTVPGATASITSTTSTTEPSEAAAGKAYQLGDSIGKSGVERSYEEHLRAVPGERTIEVNAKGDLIDVVSRTSPEAGDDVWLTIDADLQAYAERLLAAKIEALRGKVTKDGRLNVPQGSVVIQDPTNGQILAMASYPTYDPAWTVNGISTQLWDQLNDPNQGKPLINWATQGTYAPGSTFKLFTAYAGISTGYLNGGREIYNDTGVYKVPGCESGKCEFTNAGSVPHYRVDLARSLTVSSDTYYYRMGDDFWRGRELFGETPIQDAAALFGLGRKTGIPLAGENPGRLPTPEGRREAYAANPEVFLTDDWYAGDNIITAIGQGDVLATPLQLANGYSAFANGGTLYRPQVVLQVTRPEDRTLPANQEGNYRVVTTVGAEQQGTIPFAPDQFAKLWDGLVGVTQKGDGTAYGAWHDAPTAWPMAGKTGTAQVNKKADTALFVGFGPAVSGQLPRYTISVVIPEAGFGGEVAAPLAFHILKPASEGALPPACPAAQQAQCDVVLAQAEQAAAYASGGSTD